MSTRDPRADFAASFMDDYFAEAEEHVVSVRRNLLVIEAAIGGELPPAALEELFRSFHSLKGISAMVELREPEALAHQMESCLRAIRQGDLALDPDSFEVVVDGAKVLEATIAAYRKGETAPEVGPIVARLSALVPSSSRTAVDRRAAPAQAPAATSGSGVRRWCVTFVSSPELVNRGVKVDTIRARLQEIGQVINVSPKVKAGGGIAFEFEVLTGHEDSLAQWRDDGITYELLPEPPAAHGRQDMSGASASGPPVVSSSGAQFVRVDLVRLDELMRVVGDMVVTRARLEDALERIERHVPFQDWRALQEHSSRMERHLRDLRDGVMRVRLVPVGEIFRRMPFVVRDLAHDSGKRVRLDLTGQSTEIDKFLIERMMDPILHLVRNAISHAIETPEERVAAGKPPEGVIQLRASTAGESVVLEVIDDGRGIDTKEIVAQARRRGLDVPDGPLDSRGVLDILCASGFSTRDEADRASGRGVGMTVVRTAIQELGGTLDLETESGRGTTFRIALPLTLAITDAIIAHVGEHTFAVPQATVHEVIELDASGLHSLERNELITYRGATLPIVRVAELFRITSAPRARLHAIVVGTGRAAVGLLFDRVAGQREVVVKAVTDPLIRVDGVSGATELGDGRLVLILDVSTLSRVWRERRPRRTEKTA